MAAVFATTDLALTGATPVDFVPDPGASNQSELLLFTVWNRDTVTQTITVQKTGGTVTPMELGTITLATLTRGVVPISGAVVTNGQKIQALLPGAHTTTAPACHASWFTIP